jgi:hypothetical protein
VRRVALPVHERGQDDALLLRRDKTPNRRGALAILEGLGLAVENGNDLVVRVGSGSVVRSWRWARTSWGSRQSPSRARAACRVWSSRRQGRAAARLGIPDLYESLAAAAAGTGTALVAIDAFESPLTEGAAVVLPALTYGEIEGTITTSRAASSACARGSLPARKGLPVYRIAQEIARRLGAQLADRHGAQETFSALSAEIPAFAGLSYAKVGEHGTMLAGAEAEGGAEPRTGGEVQAGGDPKSGGGAQASGGTTPGGGSGTGAPPR